MGGINGLFSDDSRLIVQGLIDVKDQVTAMQTAVIAALTDIKDVMTECLEELQSIKEELEGE